MINILEEENVVVLKHESLIKIDIWTKYDSQISFFWKPPLIAFLKPCMDSAAVHNVCTEQFSVSVVIVYQTIQPNKLMNHEVSLSE